MTKITSVTRRALEHRRLPLVLAIAAMVFMLPALPIGLLGDDLVQRLQEFPNAELPARVLDIGFVAKDSGKLSTVMANLFGFVRSPDAARQARDYGILPWWSPENWTAALWRPVTALTHWLDYQLFPKSPWLMHAENFVWYGAAVFLVAALYRKIAVSEAGEPSAIRTSVCVAGVAACLWMFDKNTYFPVAYVANRGFIMSLVFGLLCWRAHIQWRTGNSTVWMWISALCLLLSLLADEGGASTLAFLMAYALVLDKGGWRSRLASLLPAAAVVIGWRAVYMGLGYGVKNTLLYVDPGYSPLLFLKDVFPRVNGLLGGQLTGFPPEVGMALNAKWQMILALGFFGFSALCAVAFLPVLRRDATARFWAVLMLLALAPAATVVPLTKNLGFVAVGAFGLIASFLVNFVSPEERAGLPVPIRAISWCAAIALTGAHIPGALAGRMALAAASAQVPKFAAQLGEFERSLDIGERDLVVVNDPMLLCAVVPFDSAYRGNPLPKSLRTLVPGSTSLNVSRPDASTLILKAKGYDLFACPAVGPIHISYACKSASDFLFGGMTWKVGDIVRTKGFQAEILKISPTGVPTSISFHFDTPLESSERVWLFFDWRHMSHSPFTLPGIGESVDIPGAD